MHRFEQDQSLQAGLVFAAMTINLNSLWLLVFLSFEHVRTPLRSSDGAGEC